MILRRLLPLALLLTWTALPALAQGVKVAGADGAAKAAGEAKKDEAKPKAKAKTKAKAKKKTESKYRTRVLTENTVSTYRFNADADPIESGKKKSSAAKAKKSQEDTEAGKPTGKCAEDVDSCSERPSEADAL